MANKFQKTSRKLFNSYGAAYNEPTINFPDSDTIGGAAVLKDNGNFTMQVKDPVYDLQMITDPIISEVSIVPMSSGGGIVPGMIGNSEIDTNMNPAVTSPPNTNPSPTSTETNAAEKRKKNIAIAVIAILVIVGLVFLMRKK